MESVIKQIEQEIAADYKMFKNTPKCGVVLMLPKYPRIGITRIL